MPTYAIIEDVLTLPGSDAPVAARIIATPLTEGAGLSLDDRLAMGQEICQTDPVSGNFILAIPVVEGVLWRIDAAPTTSAVIEPWPLGVYEITESAALRDMVPTNPLTVTGSLTESVFDARDEAVAAKVAAEAVGATSDAQVANNVNTGPLTGAALSAAIDSVGADKVDDDGSAIYGAIKKRSNWVNIKEFGAVGDGVTDDTAAIQAAIDSGARSLWIPEGTFIVSATLREATNGYALGVFGENKYRSVLKGAAGMNVPILWVGNNTSHSTYRSVLRNFTIEGAGSSIGSVVTGNHGLILHEAGVSMTKDLRIRYCDTAIWMPGCIGATVRDCELGANKIHIRGTDTVGGTPSGPDDITTTSPPGGARPFSINRILDNWLSGGTQGVIVEGPFNLIKGNVFQSVGDDASKAVIQIFDANSTYSFGGGPIVEENWFEGGKYLALVYIKNTRFVTVRHNYMAGNSTPGSTLSKEFAIVAVNADQLLIEHNSIFYYFDATPTESRPAASQTSSIYIDTTTTWHYMVRDNYIVRTNAGPPYYDGEAGPALSKAFDSPLVAGVFQAGSGSNTNAGSFVVGKTYNIQTVGDTDWVAIGAASNTVGVVFVATGVGSGTGVGRLTAACINGKQVTSVTRNSTGRYQVFNSGKFNLLDQATCLPQVTVIGTVICFAVIAQQLATATEIKFYDAAGALVDPDGFALMVFGAPVNQGT